MTRWLFAALALVLLALPSCLDFDAAALACRQSGRCGVDGGSGGGAGGGGADDAGTGGFGGSVDDAGTGGGGGSVDDAGTGGGGGLDDAGTGGGAGTAVSIGAVVSGAGRSTSATYTFDVTVGAPSGPTTLSGSTVQLEVVTPVKP